MLCRELEVSHRSFVRRSRPRKDKLDTLLAELAQLFVRHAGQDRDVLLLEPAEASHFIQFCHAALGPLSGRDRSFALSEVSHQALSQRWRRFVLASGGPASR